MCRGDLASWPAEKRLWYLPRHCRQWLRLSVPLQAHPREETPVPCLQSKNKSQSISVQVKTTLKKTCFGPVNVKLK